MACIILPFSSFCRQHPSIPVVWGPETVVLHVLTEQECTAPAVPPAWNMLGEYPTVRTTRHSLRKTVWSCCRGPRWPWRRLSHVPALLHQSPLTPSCPLPPPPPQKKARGHKLYILNLPRRPPGVVCAAQHSLDSQGRAIYL